MEWIDVSSNNGCDVTRWLSSCDGVVVKVSEDGGYHNPCYRQQLAAARAAGKAVGHYAFARPSTSTPDHDFSNFASLADVRPGEWIALDFEDDKFRGDGTAWARYWVALARSHYPDRPVLIYSYGPYLSAHVHEAVAPLWYANYSHNQSPAPAPWTAYNLWQYTSTPIDRSRGTVPWPLPPAPTPAPPKPKGDPVFIFSIPPHPHTFVCGFGWARWHHDAEDHNVSVWELAVAGQAHDVQVLTVEQATKYPLVGDIDPELLTLGFKALRSDVASVPPAQVDDAAVAVAVANLLAARLQN